MSQSYEQWTHTSWNPLSLKIISICRVWPLYPDKTLMSYWFTTIFLTIPLVQLRPCYKVYYQCNFLARQRDRKLFFLAIATVKNSAISHDSCLKSGKHLFTGKVIDHLNDKDSYRQKHHWAADCHKTDGCYTLTNCWTSYIVCITSFADYRSFQNAQILTLHILSGENGST